MFCIFVLIMVVLYSSFLILSCVLSIHGSLGLHIGVGLCYVLASDSSSTTFALTLVLISISVLIWSYYYIDNELEYRTFVILLLCFLVTMFILVFSADLLSLFVAWDLLGFTSFFLVVYYRSRVSLSGGMLTGLTNRVGDVLLLAFFGFSSYSSCDLNSWFFLLLLWVSFTKSAQVPFSRWLPAAMLAPTPVSALVHSSTLVTAGVYLLYRYSFSSHSFLTAVGIFTLLMAGMAACLESDIKKVIALSTLSHLGLMFTALGLCSRCLTFSHLVIHAAFKALLFLAVGTAIHVDYGSQESRSKLAITFCSPFVFVVLVIALASNIGLVFTSGFLSKEAILSLCLNARIGLSVGILFYTGIGLTLVYSLRLLSTVSGSRDGFCSFSPLLSVSWVVKLPLLFLSALTLLQICRSRILPLSSFGCVCFADNLLVLGVLVGSCFLNYLVRPSTNTFTNPQSLCSYSTSGLSRSFEYLTLVQGTEIAMLQGYGLGYASALVSPANGNFVVMGKFLLFIIFVFVIA